MTVPVFENERKGNDLFESALKIVRAADLGSGDISCFAEISSGLLTLNERRIVLEYRTEPMQLFDFGVGQASFSAPAYLGDF
jgi:hypothetical protein